MRPSREVKKDLDAIIDILDRIHRSEKYTQFDSAERFVTHEMAFDATAQQVIVIGEAVKRISEYTRNAYPEVPWGKLARMRDVMVHQYDRIDALILWDTVKHNLPGEVSKLEKIKSILEHDLAEYNEI